MSPPFEPVRVEEQPEREEGEMAAGEEEEEEKEPEKSGSWGTELAETTSWPVLRFDVPPRRVYHFWQQFRTGASPSDNFLKGVKWSPDGSCFLTSSDDNTLRLFYLPEEAFNDRVAREAAVDDQDSYVSSLMVSEAETVYDFCWYPYMDASDPTTCVFASTTRDHPIHLWDAISGQALCWI